MKIKIGLVDDSRLLVEALTLLLQTSEFEVVVEASTGRILQGVMEDHKEVPELMLIDTDMPVMDGTETTTWLQQHYPSIKLIVMTMDGIDRSIVKMLKAGCCSYLYKDDEPIHIEKTLRSVFEKGYYNPDKTESIWSFFGMDDKEKKIILTEDEKRFLDFSFTDLSYHHIVHEMNITQRMANKFIASLFRKFRVRSRPGLVLEAIRNADRITLC